MAPAAKSANAIIQAEEYLKIGDKISAIQCLYDSLDPSRNKIWSPSIEEAAMMLLTICIDLLESDVVKEALSQYRNICQLLDPESMMRVVNNFLDACLKKITDAQEKYHIEDFSCLDLEEEVDATSIILGVSYEQDDIKRVQHEVFYPLIKFYWDNLRNILDLLKINNTMEDLYHSVCERAFNFCLVYHRTSEFRTLRFLLYKHLVSLTNPSQDSNNQRFRLVWSAKTAELQMKTRIAQLDVACKLGLWTEAINIVTDIRSLSMKSSMLAEYYEKVSCVLWELKKYFYHAYALLRMLALHKRQNKELSEEKLRAMATQACLASLCVPIYSIGDDESHPAFKIEREKDHSLSRVLGLPSHMTREALHNELCTLDVLSFVPAELSELYNILESEFHPLDMVARVSKLLAFVANIPEYSQYVPQLRRMVFLRVLTQLESVYSVMKLENYTKIIDDLKFDRYEAERLVVEASSSNQLHIRFDYMNKCVYFNHGVADKDIITHYMSSLSSNLRKAMALVNPSNQQLEDEENDMDERMELARSTKDLIHEDMLTRFREIQTAKQEAERKEREKNMTEAERIKRESQERERREEERLQEEERRRLQEERDRALKRENEAKRAALIAQLRKLQGRSYDAEFAEAMDLEELSSYIVIAEAKAEKERKKRVEKESERQLHIARATREAILEATEKFFADRQAACVEYWTQSYNTIAEQRRAQAERLEAVRPVATKVGAFLSEYAIKVGNRHLEVVQANVEKRFQEAEKKRKEEEERKRKEEEARRAEEERRRAEAEKKRKEEEARRAAEEARKRKEEEEMRRVEEVRKRKEEEARANRMALMNDDDDDGPRTRTRGGRSAPGSGRSAPGSGRSAPGRGRPAPTVAASPASEPSRPAPRKDGEDDDGWVEVRDKRRPAPRKDDDDDGWVEIRRGRPAPSSSPGLSRGRHAPPRN